MPTTPKGCGITVLLDPKSQIDTERFVGASISLNAYVHTEYHQDTKTVRPVGFLDGPDGQSHLKSPVQ